MSNLAITWALSQKTGSPTSKLILLKLADQANDEGFCWPSQTTISKHCEVSRETVNRHIKRLESSGFLRVQRRFDGNCQLSSYYHLNILNPPVIHNHNPCDPKSHPPVTQDHTPCDSGSHKPSYNPHIEPSLNQSPYNPPKGENGQTEQASKSYPEEFEQAWSAYPKRDGGNPKRRAYNAWKARIKAGHESSTMVAGAERYAAHVQAHGTNGTRFVMQAATFFGPDERFLEEWPSQAAEKANEKTTTPSDFVMRDFC